MLPGQPSKLMRFDFVSLSVLFQFLKDIAVRFVKHLSVFFAKPPKVCLCFISFNFLCIIMANRPPLRYGG